MILIDADTLKAEFTGNFHELWHYTGVRAIIDNAPTVEPKKGKWIDKRAQGEDLQPWHKRYFCSICDYDFTEGWYHFCPNCGADMRETND